jgi:hypothetical protein
VDLARRIESVGGELRNDGDLIGVMRCICCDGDGAWNEVVLPDSQELLDLRRYGQFAAMRCCS